MLRFLPRKVFRSALAEGDFALRSLNQQVYKIFPFLAYSSGMLKWKTVIARKELTVYNKHSTSEPNSRLRQ